MRRLSWYPFRAAWELVLTRAELKVTLLTRVCPLHALCCTAAPSSLSCEDGTCAGDACLRAEPFELLASCCVSSVCEWGELNGGEQAMRLVRELILREAAVGQISRMEAVSMLPALCLDPQPGEALPCALILGQMGSMSCVAAMPRWMRMWSGTKEGDSGRIDEGDNKGDLCSVAQHFIQGTRDGLPPLSPAARHCSGK